MKQFRLVALTAALGFVVACGGGSSSPTSPTAAAPTTRVISISGSLAFGDVLVGSTSELTITINNSGTGTLTITNAQGPAGSASLFAITFGSSTVPPGGSTTARVRFTPGTTGVVSGTLTLVTDSTSGTNTISYSGTGITAPMTLVGVVTNSSTRAALSGVRVTATAGSATVATATTDGNGYYSMVLPTSTSLNLNYTLNGYNIVNATATFTSDTRRDQTLTVSTPAAPALEYRVIGSRASLTYSNCSEGTSQVSSATLPWSFTCSSVPSGQFIYISAQNTGDSGTITVQIYKRGVLFRESSSQGAFAIATASGSY